MARLPDIQDVGARPTPQSSRQVVSVRNAGAVGEAVSDFGAKGSAVGLRLEEIHDEADVRRLDVEHAAEARQIRQTAREARGVNAAAARTKADEDLRLLDARIAGRARSKTSREAIETLVTRRSSLERDAISEHALRETVAAQDAAITARIETSVEEAAERWENPEAVNQALNTAVVETQNRGRSRGFGSSQIESEISGVRSQVRSAVVEQMIQTENFDGAEAYLQAHSGEIRHEQEVALRRIVNGGLRALEDDRVAAWAVGSGEAGVAPVPTAGPVPPAAPQTLGAGPAAPPERSGGWRVISRPGASRGGGTRTHQGYDIAPTTQNHGWYPNQAFRVENVRVGRPTTEAGQHYPDGLTGNTADVVLADGTKLTLRHLQTLPTAGQYRAGQLAAIAGNTGNARSTVTHFHVEGTRNGQRVDPSGYFGAGSAGNAAGSAPPDGTTIDLDRAYARIDALDLTPSAKLRARDRVRDLAAQNDQVRNRVRQDADEEITRALTAIAGRNERLTNISQLPTGALTRASPNTLLQINETIRANNQPREPEANSPLIGDLVQMSTENPSGFLAINPELYRGRITDSEVLQLRAYQNQIRNRDPAAPSEIIGMINMVISEGGLVPDQVPRNGNETPAAARARAERQARAQLLPAVQERLARLPQGTRVTPQHIRDAVLEETAPSAVVARAATTVARQVGGTPGRDIPARALPIIDSILRAQRLQPTAANRLNLYNLNRARIDAALN